MVIFKGTTAGVLWSWPGSLITGSLFVLPNNFFRTAVAELIGFETTEVTVVVVFPFIAPAAAAADDRLASAAWGVVMTAVLDLKSK